MHTRSSDLTQKSSFQIKQDDKFYSRLLSKEISSNSNIANSSSFRVYYGVAAAGAVPFMWESQPGTPKHDAMSKTTLPPLTPPPSYNYNTPKNPTKKTSRSSNLLNTIIPRLNVKRAHHVTPSSPLSSSSSAAPSLSSSSSSYNSLSSFSSPSSPSTPSRPSINSRRRSRLSTARLSFSSSSMGDDEYPAIGSPTSPFCFPMSRGQSTGGGGCYSMVGMKNALLSIVGHGSS